MPWREKECNEVYVILRELFDVLVQCRPSIFVEFGIRVTFRNCLLENKREQRWHLIKRY